MWHSRLKATLVALTILATMLVGIPSALAAETADWLPFKVDDGVVEVGCTWNNGCNGNYHGTSGLGPSIDFIAPFGTPVYAAGPGTVIASNNTCHPSDSPGCSGSRGRFVEIKHPDGRHSRYLHLSEVLVTFGEVARGDLIGKVGNSGGSPVPHLHYDENINGAKVNPGPMKAVHGSNVVSYPNQLHHTYDSWDDVPAWSDRFVYSSSSGGTTSLNWSIDGSGYWHGTPPDGMVIFNNEAGGHRYVAAGGSLFYYNGSTPGLNDEFIEQMRQRHGTTQPAWMRNDEIHAIEGSIGRDSRRRPDNNTFVVDKQHNVWYVMQYGFAWPLRSQEEVAYLGGTGKQIVLPAGSMSGFQAAPTEWPTQIPDTTGNVTVLKALDDPAFYEMQAERMYWVDNNTVLDCIVRYKGGAIQQVPLSMIHRFVDDHRPTGSISHCGFPPNVALYGPGGQERWYLYGTNPYTRYQYASEFAMRCRWGDNLQLVEISREALNQATPTPEILHCPDDSYVKNRQNGEVFRVLSGTLHYVPSHDTLRCLVGGTPGEPTPVDEAILAQVPRGADAACTYEGKLVQAPSGQVYWVRDGQRHYVGNELILSCVRGRTNAGNVTPVPQGTIDSYPEGLGAYCPYPAEVRFVRGEGQPEVWQVYTDGTRQHALNLCVDNAENPATDPRFRVHIMPAGEVDGHRLRDPSTFSATPEMCNAIP